MIKTLFKNFAALPLLALTALGLQAASITPGIGLESIWFRALKTNADSPAAARFEIFTNAGGSVGDVWTKDGPNSYSFQPPGGGLVNIQSMNGRGTNTIFFTTGTSNLLLNGPIIAGTNGSVTLGDGQGFFLLTNWMQSFFKSTVRFESLSASSLLMVDGSKDLRNVTIGSGLSLVGSTLSATASGGTFNANQFAGSSVISIAALSRLTNMWSYGSIVFLDDGTSSGLLDVTAGHRLTVVDNGVNIHAFDSRSGFFAASDVGSTNGTPGQPWVRGWFRDLNVHSNFFAKDIWATNAASGGAAVLRVDSNGKIQPVTIGANLSFDGATLSATGGGGSGNLITNGNQFGASVTLTLKAGLKTTNETHYGIITMQDDGSGNIAGVAGYGDKFRVYDASGLNGLFDFSGGAGFFATDTRLASSNGTPTRPWFKSWVRDLHSLSNIYATDLWITNAGSGAAVILRVDSSGKVNPVTIGANLSFDGTTLSATGGGGGSLQTNSFQFGPAVVLTLVDGVRTTNLLDYGTLTVANGALTVSGASFFTNNLTVAGTLRVSSATPSSLTRFDASGNLSAATIGSGISWDGSTISASAVPAGGLAAIQYISNSILAGNYNFVYTNRSVGIGTNAPQTTLHLRTTAGIFVDNPDAVSLPNLFSVRYYGLGTENISGVSNWNAYVSGGNIVTFRTDGIVPFTTDVKNLGTRDFMWKSNAVDYFYASNGFTFQSGAAIGAVLMSDANGVGAWTFYTNMPQASIGSITLTNQFNILSRQPTVIDSQLICDGSLGNVFVLPLKDLGTGGTTNLVFTNIANGQTIIAKIWPTNGVAVSIKVNAANPPNQWYTDGSQVAVVSNGWNLIEVTRNDISGGISPTNITIHSPTFLLVNDGATITSATNWASRTVTWTSVGGGGGSLQTNANQFGAQVRLTIKATPYLTNVTDFGTMAVNNLVITQSVAFPTIPINARANVTQPQIDFSQGVVWAVTNMLDGQNITFYLTNFTDGKRCTIRIPANTRGSNSQVTVTAAATGASTTNIYWHSPTNGSFSFIAQTNGTYTVTATINSTATRTNIDLTWSSDVNTPSPRGVAVGVPAGWAGKSNAWVGGRLVQILTAVPVPTSNNTPSTAVSTTISGNTMTNNGDTIRLRLRGVMPANQANSNRFLIVFGGTTILDTGIQPASNTVYNGFAELTRTGLSAQHVNAGIVWGPGGGVPFAFTNVDLELTTIANGADQTLAFQSTGHRQGSSTNTFFDVEYYPAAQ